MPREFAKALQADIDTANVRRCLDLLQQAQGIINEAAAALSSVPGFALEWGEMGQAYNAVKAQWHAVASRRNRILDAKRRDALEPTAALDVGKGTAPPSLGGAL